MTAAEADLELLEQWKRGDVRAGNRLFERHFESVYRFFVHKTADEDAIDLVQRTFLACVEARERFRAASSFRTFVFAIARNELLAHWRNRRKRALDTAQTSICDLAPSPSTVMVRRFEHRALLDALRSIPIDLQIALELHYWEQMSSAEIADVLGVPVGTAKSRVRRAREALTEAMAKLEDDPERIRTTLANLDAWAASLKEALLVDRPHAER